jgi:hypothetical protein
MIICEFISGILDIASVFVVVRCFLLLRMHISFWLYRTTTAVTTTATARRKK